MKRGIRAVFRHPRTAGGVAWVQALSVAIAGHPGRRPRSRSAAVIARTAVHGTDALGFRICGPMVSPAVQSHYIGMIITKGCEMIDAPTESKTGKRSK